MASTITPVEQQEQKQFFAFNAEDESGHCVQVRVLRLLKLMKLLRVIRINKLLEAVENRFVVDYSVLQMFQHILTVVLVTHWATCGLLLFLHLEVWLPFCDYDQVACSCKHGVDRACTGPH
jgi:hypothetical protein